MAVLAALWQSSLLICIRITVVTCNHASLSHLLHPIKSRCADVDGQLLVHIHTRTWQNLKKRQRQSPEVRLHPPVEFFGILVFFHLLLICLLLQIQIWMEKSIYRPRKNLIIWSESSTGSFPKELLKLFSLTSRLCFHGVFFRLTNPSWKQKLTRWLYL